MLGGMWQFPSVNENKCANYVNVSPNTNQRIIRYNTSVFHGGVD